ncbi:MAG TPA: thioredoxin domain-containing protein [Methylomirabilota bacterium]
MARVFPPVVRAAAVLFLVAWAAAAQADSPPRFTVDPTMTRGPAGAPVTIFEWSDYQCPFCREAQSVLGRLQAEFPDKIRIAFKDFPLRSHNRAMPAAVAARCAGAQGRYFEYHDLLFLAQPDFSRDDLLGYARRLGLDLDAFAQCFDSARYQDAVLADQREGREAGVRATPTFFINGRKIEGALPIETFREAVQQALRDPR